MTDDSGDIKRPAEGLPDGDDRVDASRDLTAELLPDEVVASLGRTRIWSFHPGQVVAERYRIIRTIAQGGMGEVYEADDLELGGRVALKTIRAEAAAQEVLLGRFRREIQIARRVTHPNVCRLFDVSYHTIEIVGSSHLTNRLMCVSMELLDGETLSQRISRDGAMGLEEALPIVRQMADGLAAAHAAGVIHRDFKSGNVMLVKAQGSEAGDAKVRAVITDFGLARHAETTDRDASLTDSGVIVGTPAYMAPEQFEGKEATSASDIYSFGVVLYEMVTGRKPFDGATPISQAIQRLKAPPSSPARFCEGLEPAWERTILRCLESDPAARFSSPHDVVVALEGQPVAPARGRQRNKTMRRQQIDRAAALVAIAIVSSMAGLGLYRLAAKSTPLVKSSTAEATPVIEVRPGAAVIGFKDLSGMPESRWLSTAFAEMIRTELAAGGTVRLVSGEDSSRARLDLALGDADMYSRETLVRIRESIGADLVICGSYLAIPGTDGFQVRLDVRLQDARTGQTVAALQESGTESELIGLVAKLGRRLREHLGTPSLTTEQATGLAAMRPQTTEVVRLYTEGLELLRRFDALAAQQKLQEAIRLQPNYPLAYAALADSWLTLGHGPEASRAAKKAQELSGGLNREDQLVIEGLVHVTSADWKQAEEVFSALSRVFPDSVEFGLKLAGAQTEGGDGDAALDTIDRLRRLPEPLRSDPRIDLAEAAAAAFRGDFERETQAADAAYKRAKKTGSPLLRAQAALQKGWGLRELSRLEEAAELVGEARREFERVGDRGGVARATYYLATIRDDQGDTEGAERLYREALGVARAIGWKRGESQILNSYGNSSTDPAQAEKLFEESLRIAREIGNDRFIAARLTNLAYIDLIRGDLRRASDRTNEAMTLAAHINDEYVINVLKWIAAETRLAIGDLAGAEASINECLPAFRKIGNRRLEAYATLAAGKVRFARGDLGGAKTLYGKSLALRERAGETGTAAESRIALGWLALAESRYEDASRFAEEAAEVFRKQKSEGFLSEALLIKARAELESGRTAEAAATAAEAARLAQRFGAVPRSIAVKQSMALIALKTGRTAEARRLADDSTREAAGNGLRVMELEGRLVGLKVYGDDAAARSIAADARKRGFEQIAREAEKFEAALAAR